MAALLYDYKREAAWRGMGVSWFVLLLCWKQGSEETAKQNASHIVAQDRDQKAYVDYFRPTRLVSWDGCANQTFHDETLICF